MFVFTTHYFFFKWYQPGEMGNTYLNLRHVISSSSFPCNFCHIAFSLGIPGTVFQNDANYKCDFANKWSSTQFQRWIGKTTQNSSVEILYPQILSSDVRTAWSILFETCEGNIKPKVPKTIRPWRRKDFHSHRQPGMNGTRQDAPRLQQPSQGSNSLAAPPGETSS